MKPAVRARLKLIKLTHFDTDKCIFCGSRAVTREHVFSKWTHKLFLRTNRKARRHVSVIHADRTDVIDGLKMPGSILDWQIRCVCGACNNGWMRKDIEERAQLIIEPMVGGKRLRLSEADQQALAVWAILKVMVVHHRFIHHAQLKQMRAKREPPRTWNVWIATCDRRSLPAQWITRPFGLDPSGSSRRSGRRGGVSNSHATTQIMNNLLIHVVKLPLKDFASKWRWTDAKGAHFKGTLLQIWPPSRQSYLWPQKPLTDFEADDVADNVFRGFLRLAAAEGFLPPTQTAS
jgi:hypothetical protein